MPKPESVDGIAVASKLRVFLAKLDHEIAHLNNVLLAGAVESTLDLLALSTDISTRIGLPAVELARDVLRVANRVAGEERRAKLIVKLPRPSPYQVWLLIEREENEGTDWYRVVSVHHTEELAQAAQSVFEKEHGNEDGDWCECHGQDWRVEGPFEVQYRASSEGSDAK